MTLPNQKFREAVLQLLYSYDWGVPDEALMIPLIMNELSITKKSAHEAFEMAKTVRLKREELDAYIAKTTEEHLAQEIHSVERNILRLGIFEIIHRKDVPPVVAIAEGIRLAKKFSTPQATSLINAILDRVYKESHG